MSSHDRPHFINGYCQCFCEECFVDRACACAGCGHHTPVPPLRRVTPEEPKVTSENKCKTPSCGGTLPKKAGRGRPPVYCETCRSKK